MKKKETGNSFTGLSVSFLFLLLYVFCVFSNTRLFRSV